MFAKFDEAGKGRLSASKVHAILSKSKLPNNLLARIWKLSDVDKYVTAWPAHYCYCPGSTHARTHAHPCRPRASAARPLQALPSPPPPVPHPPTPPPQTTK